MRLRRRDVFKVATSSAAAVAATKLASGNAIAASAKRIVRDVCVIGGGSSGTYTAVRLRDLGKSVVVLEKKERLGGHAETVHVGPSNTPIDIGVVVFETVPLVTNYFARFNVALAPFAIPPSATGYVDFRTGRTVNYTPPGQAAFGQAFGTYLQILATQFAYLDSGFNLPNPVPADLLLPFGDFVTKYGLDALVPTIFAFGQGLGNLLSDPTLYVLKNFSLSVAGSLAQGAFAVVPAGTGALYDAAKTFLGQDAVVNTCVTRVVRSASGTHVFADTPTGPIEVVCQKLVIAMPPTLQNLAPLDLDAQEVDTFGRLRANYYATALVKLTGLPPGLTVQNVGANTRDNLAALPGMYSISPTQVEGYYNIKYGSAFWLPDEITKANIVADILRIRAMGTYPIQFHGFEAFASHAPFEMMVTPAEIAGGYYTRLNALQGRHNTYYTGAAFQTNDSSLIWQFTEGLLPTIAA